jgi:4-amino-4-deoxy-L-arabinose transferase-like glycosyltransferase
VLDLVAAAGFRLAGGEELWIPRLVSSALWILGGIFLYFIARRLTTRPGALVALALYLLWPYGAFISRLYMPDAMMMALLLAGALTVIRYWERPSFGRLLAAGIVSGAANAAKPGVAIIFLLALFVALALSRRALVESVTRGGLRCSSSSPPSPRACTTSTAPSCRISSPGNRKDASILHS